MNNYLLNKKSTGPNRGAVYFAKVLRFYPTTNTADAVEAVDGGRTFPNCPILCSVPAGFAYGTRYYPTHDDQNTEAEYVNSPGDIYCVAMYVENDYNSCVIIGFMFPTQTTLSIAEYGLHIFRHESDVIWMVRGDGTVQIYHPSGSFIKIGDDDTNEVDASRADGGLYPSSTDDLYLRPPDDYNKAKTSNLFINWYKGQKVKLDSDGNIVASTEDAQGAVVSSLTMTPDGKVTVFSTDQVNVNTKDINVTASGNVVANVIGNADITVEGDVTANVTGDATANVTGDATVTANKSNVNALTSVNVVATTIANITGGTGVNITAVTGPIVISAPTNKVLVQGTHPSGYTATNFGVYYN
jgi:hypothetical protein